MVGPVIQPLANCIIHIHMPTHKLSQGSLSSIPMEYTFLPFESRQLNAERSTHAGHKPQLPPQWHQDFFDSSLPRSVHDDCDTLVLSVKYWSSPCYIQKQLLMHLFDFLGNS